MNIDFYRAKHIEIIKYVSLLLMGIAVATKTGFFIVLGMTLALIALPIDKNRFSNIKSKPFVGTIVLFSIYVLLVYIECFHEGNSNGARLILRNFEKIATFFVIYFLIGDVRKPLFFASIGLMIGILVNTGIVCMQMNDSLYEFGNRYAGIFGHPNSLGAVLVLQIPVFIYLAYCYQRNKIVHIPCCLMILCIFFNLYMTGSRGAFMAIITEIVIILQIYLFRTLRIKNKGLESIYILSTFVIILAIMFGTALFFGREYDNERVLLWTSTWKMFLDYPLLGVGFDNWQDFYSKLYISPWAKEPDLPSPHNLFLLVLAETGIVGLTAYLSLIFWQIKESIKYSCIETSLYSRKLTTGDLFIAVTIGMVIQNMVDVSAVIRYYMLMHFFIWGVCCIHYTNIDKHIGTHE